MKHATCLVLRSGSPDAQTNRAGGSKAGGKKADQATPAEAGIASEPLSEVVAQQGRAQIPVVVGIVQDRRKLDLELNEIPLNVHPACLAHRDTPNSCCKQVCFSGLCHHILMRLCSLFNLPSLHLCMVNAGQGLLPSLRHIH